MADANAAWNAAALHLERDHIRVGRLVTYALVIAGPDDLRDDPSADADRLIAIAETIKASLTSAERQMLAILACASTTDAELVAVMAAAYPNVHIEADAPGATYEAASWAAFADAPTVDAYALACFRQMTPGRQAEFIDYVTKYKDG